MMMMMMSMKSCSINHVKQKMTRVNKLGSTSVVNKITER